MIIEIITRIYKVGLSPSKMFVLLASMKALLNDEICFLFNFKSFFLFLRYLNLKREQLDKTARSILKFYGVTAWITSNYSTRVSQYLKK